MKFFSKLINGYVVTAFVAAYFIMAAVVMQNASGQIKNDSGQPESTILDLRMTYTGEEAYQLLDDMGNEGRAAYKKTAGREDIIYPLIYGGMLILGIIFFLKRSFPDEPKLGLLAVLPVFAVLFDFAENSSIIMMISHYPEQNTDLGNYAGKMTLLKWGFVFISVFIFLISFMIYLFKKLVMSRNRKKPVH